jgi:hypothetical protein
LGFAREEERNLSMVCQRLTVAEVGSSV